jgi:hypothetical protein
MTFHLAILSDVVIWFCHVGCNLALFSDVVIWVCHLVLPSGVEMWVAFCRFLALSSGIVIKVSIWAVI